MIDSISAHLQRSIRHLLIVGVVLLGSGLLTYCGVDSQPIALPPESTIAAADHAHHSPTHSSDPPAATNRPATPTAISPSPAVSSPPTPAIELRGSGEQASTTFTLKAGLALIRYDHPAATPFGMFLMNRQGDHLALLANGAAISGTQGYGIPADGDYYLHVLAEDAWSASVEQPRPDELSRQAQQIRSVQGSGATVSQPLRLRAGAMRLRWQQQGALPFEVVLWNSAGTRRVDVVSGSLVSEGTAPIELPADDIYVLNVQSDGDWAIALDAGSS